MTQIPTLLRSLPKQLGMLRMMLVILSLGLIITNPGQEVPEDYTGWNAIPAIVMPACVPMVFMGLLLDALMSRVWMVDTEGLERKRFKTIMIIDLLLAVLLFIAWLPYFLAIGGA